MFGVPSLATSSFLPSGVKVTMSGKAPTVTELMPVASERVVVSKNRIVPGSVRSADDSMATAARPLLMAMLLALPKPVVSMCCTRPPVLALSTSMPTSPTTHSVLLTESKLAISEVWPPP